MTQPKVVDDAWQPDILLRLLGLMVEAKSRYTNEHCMRVPALSDMIVRAACEAEEGFFRDFHLNEEERYEFHLAGWLHDCGKIIIPDHILDKATKLEAVHDRIGLVLARGEILKRDLEIEYLRARTEPDAEVERLLQDHQEAICWLEDALAFLTRVNRGEERMDEAARQRLQDIAAHTVTIQGQRHLLLTPDELRHLSIPFGTLTDEERQIVQDHVTHTIRMLESLPWPEHLKRVPVYAGAHHERMDGKGYPYGIRAAELPIPARIMAVADVFEALTATDRPYKKPKKLSEAMAILAQFKRNYQLDPDIVDFFVSSGIYRSYAAEYLDDSLLDEVDEEGILAIRPKAA